MYIYNYIRIYIYTASSHGFSTIFRRKHQFDHPMAITEGNVSHRHRHNITYGIYYKPKSINATQRKRYILFNTLIIRD